MNVDFFTQALIRQDSSPSKIFFFEMLKRKDRIARESFNALIPCRKPKSNDNGKYKRD